MTDIHDDASGDAAREVAVFLDDLRGLEGPENDNGRPEATAEVSNTTPSLGGATAQANISTELLGNASENALTIATAMVKVHLTPTPLKPEEKGAFLPAWNTDYAPRSLNAVRDGIAALGPHCNVGNINGAPIDDKREWFLVDGDIKASKDGKRPACTIEEYFDELASTLGIEVEDLKTVTALSGSGGPHLYFWTLRGTYTGNKQYSVTPRTEFPQQIVAPGSRVEGREYKWREGLAPGQTPFKRAPQELIDAYRAAKGGSHNAAGKERTREKPAYEPDRPEDIGAMRKWLRDPGPNGAPHAGDGRSGTGTVINMAFLQFNPTPETLVDVLMEPGGWNETKTKTPWALDGRDNDADGNLEKYVYDQYADLEEAPGSHKRPAVDDAFDTVEGVDGATGVEWPEPTPLPGDLAPVAPFDPAFLPDSIAAWVTDIAEQIQCAPDYAAIAAMVALGSVLGNKVAICPRRKGAWQEHPNLWGVVIDDPGRKKSPAMEAALRPVKQLESEAQEAGKPALAAYNKAQEAHKLRKLAAERAYLAACKKEPNAPAPNLPPEPVKPKARRYKVDDVTYEKMGEILADNPNGVLSFRDELVTLLSDLGKKENASGRGLYLTAWSGKQSYSFDRIGRGSVHIEAACLSVLGTTQPGRFTAYARQALGADGNDGLLQRFSLLVWPDHGKEWELTDREPDDFAQHVAMKVFRHLDKLGAETPFDDVHADATSLFEGEAKRTIDFRFAAEAQPVFDAWLTHNERRVRSDDLPPNLREHFSKYSGLVPALALINHLADWGDGDVGVGALEKAIAFVGYLETHARRAYGSGPQDEVAAAKAILRQIKSGGLSREGFTARDIYRKQWTGLGRETTRVGLGLLIAFDWIRETKTSGPGRPTISYTVNPKATL
jgi:hypothetical protein